MAATCIVTVMVCVTFYQLRQRQQPVVLHSVLPNDQGVSISFCKQLRQSNAKCYAYFLKRRNCWHHILTIPRRYGGLGQARVFRKLILRPASFFSICGYGCKNIFHYTHPFACILRKLYFDESLQYNYLCRIILTIYTTKDR